MSASGSRSIRVAVAVKDRLSRAIARQIDDPLLKSVVITDVKVSDDLSIARIKVRLLVGDQQESQRRDAVSKLRRASARLRKALVGELRLKKLPELRFDYDIGHDAAERIDQLLREIEQERSEHGKPPDDDT